MKGLRPDEIRQRENQSDYQGEQKEYPVDQAFSNELARDLWEAMSDDPIVADAPTPETREALEQTAAQ